jgi:hypothetical protein
MGHRTRSPRLHDNSQSGLQDGPCAIAATDHRVAARRMSRSGPLVGPLGSVAVKDTGIRQPLTRGKLSAGESASEAATTGEPSG